MTKNILLEGIIMAFIVGQVAMGDNFWDRAYELEDIWDAIENGSHVLLSAPRRVGKTSIMRKMQHEPKEGYFLIYIDTESADKENEFWHKLFHLLMEEKFIATTKTKAKNILSILKNISIQKISIKGVEFGDGKLVDFKEAFKRVINDMQSDKKLIIMINEFAQTIENIIKYESEKSALSLLKAHHELRQNSDISSKITFVYAGSIGLESVVRKINGTKYINDLNSIKIAPLDFDSATEFIHQLLEKNNFSIEDSQIKYMLNKIEWLIPFYIQLILQEIKKLYRRDPNITDTLIDKAIDNAIEHRNYFDHWQTKLKEAFTNQSYLFAKEILNTICEKTKMTSSEILNIAKKHSLNEDKAKETIHSLVYDGYINNNDNPKQYRFNSPILRQWWCKYVAN